MRPLTGMILLPFIPEFRDKIGIMKGSIRTIGG
jgi:hypothetical protein